MPAGGVEEEHFRLLTEFGRSKLQKTITEDQREHLWKLMCQGANVPYVAHQVVIDEWRKFVVGKAKDSSLALSATAEPEFVSIGVTFKGKLVAAHTTRTRAFTKSILRAFAVMCGNEDDFKREVNVLVTEICENKGNKRKK